MFFILLYAAYKSSNKSMKIELILDSKESVSTMQLEFIKYHN
jgi:hypothetical protein